MKTFHYKDSVIILACLLPCFRVLTYTDWYIDELPALVRNGLVNGDFPIWKILTHDFWGNPLWEEERATHKSFRPIPTLIWRFIAYLQGGVYPFGFRLACCLCHICATYMLVLVSRQLGSTRWPCLLSACMFACHPVHCENLAYIVGFADSLSTVFLALAILSWSKWKSLLFCLASSLSKESGFVSFALVFLMHCLKEFNGHKRLGLAVGLATCIAPIARYLYVGGSPVNFAYADVPYIYEPDWIIRGWSYLHVHSVYARLLILPWNQSWDYSFDAVPLVRSIGDIRMLGSISTYLALFALLATTKCKPHRFVPFAIFVASFIPSSSLFLAVGTVVGERLLYPVSFGFAAFLATHEPRRLLLGFILLLYIYLFLARLSVWSNKFELYRTDAIAWPRSCKTLHQFGAVLLNTGEQEEVLQNKVLSVLEESLRIFDDNALTDYLVSQIYLEQGRLDLAIRVHEKIANGHGIGFTDFSRFMFLVDAGWALIASGNLSMYPVLIIEEGLEIFPYVAHARNAAAVAYMAQGKMVPALAHLQLANEVAHFENPVVWNNLAVWYWREGRVDTAEECFGMIEKSLGAIPNLVFENLDKKKKFGKSAEFELALYYDRMK